MFSELKVKVDKQFDVLSKSELFKTSIDKDVLFQAYLESFPEENRQYYNCNCCKHFLNNYGDVVAIVNNEIQTLWDFEIDEPFSEIPKILSELVRNSYIDNFFLSKEEKLGTDHNYKLLEDGTSKKWEHFFYNLPKGKMFNSKDSIESRQGELRSIKQVFKRSLDEITQESLETVLDLIEQNVLYRGQEFKLLIETFRKQKLIYDTLDNKKKELFAWENTKQGSKIRNSSIGTLLLDLSNGEDLEKSVKSFEAMVAPANYKRTTSLVSKGMILKAEEKIKELELEKSLYRRHAKSTDIPVNEVLFVNRNTDDKVSIFEELIDCVVNPKSFTKLQEVSINKFLSELLPYSTGLEVLFENKHSSNLMSLLAPVNEDSPSLFYWNNNISWDYIGNLTDSMKERVKAAGGNTDGALRFSIQWNESGDNNIDFDAHAIEPDEHEIMFTNKGRKSKLTGMLDVDIINPGKNIAVENIIWDREPLGKTILFVHNYSSSMSKEGFSAEIEYDGQIYTFNYDKRLKGNEKVIVAEIIIDKSGLNFIKSLDSQSAIISKSVWGIQTNKWQKVSLLTKSPNFWNNKDSGNEHIFFILENARNPDEPRGLYNEYLRYDLQQHRKVFEVLGNKLKANISDEQLSGLGFSITQRNDVIVKVTKEDKQTIYRIKF